MVVAWRAVVMAGSRCASWRRRSLIWSHRQGPYVRIQEELPAVAVTLRDACHAIYDFGENIAGWTPAVVQGAAGVRVTLRHAEALDAEGALYTANLRSAQQTDHYILRWRRHRGVCAALHLSRLSLRRGGDISATVHTAADHRHCRLLRPGGR